MLLLWYVSILYIDNFFFVLLLLFIKCIPAAATAMLDIIDNVQKCVKKLKQ